MESDSVLVQFFACANLRFFGWELSCWSFPNAVAYMSFPEVIENLWFVSLSCLRVQVLVRVPNFSRIYFWKKDRTLRAGLDRAREVPIVFQVQRLNHWVINILTLILFWSNPIPSSDKFLLALIFFFGWGLSCWWFPNGVAYMSFPGKVLLSIFGSSVSVACEHKYWFVFPTSSEYISENEIKGCGQGSIVRGKFPLDFKSNALTTKLS